MSTIFKYTTALWPDVYFVLGRRLEPYSLGHALLLERLRSPYVTGSVYPLRGDLKLAVSICSLPFPEALRRVSNGTLKWRMRMVRCPGRKLDQASMEFLSYLSAAFHFPKRVEKEGQKGLGTPTLQQMKVALMVTLHKTEEEALCTPLAQAFWDCSAAWELGGKTELIDDEMIEALDAARAELKEEDVS